MKNILKSVALAFVSLFLAFFGTFAMLAAMSFANRIGILEGSLLIFVISLIAITIYTVLENR